jgi:lipopolysaccharide export system permease protein
MAFVDIVGRTTLALYFGRRFAVNLFAVFCACLALIFLVDLVENLRRAGSRDVGFETVVLLSLYRAPSVSELVLPIAVLFAAMATFLLLTKSLELVVARSAGVSAWQFVAPAILVALAVGIAASTRYNPLASELRARHEVLYAEAFGGGGSLLDASRDQAWLRQRGPDGPSVLHARGVSEGGLGLHDVTVWTFDDDNRFLERIDAARARLEEGHWRFSDAWVYTLGRDPERHSAYLVSTYLTPTQVRDNLAAADAVSFWNLPQQIASAERAGLPAIQYRLQYQSLLARPLLLGAMVLIAATVSLRMFRLGSVERFVLAGIVAGFVLYVVSKLTIDLGKAGAIAPFVAAWAPAIVAALVGMTILLHQEDG